MRTHDSHFLPRLFRGKHRLIALPFPRLAVGAGRVTDPGMAFGLAGIPQVIAIVALDDCRTVEVLLPAGLGARSQHDHRLAPVDAVGAFDQREAFLWPPREPHAVGVAFLQDGDVEAGAEVAAQHGIAGVFPPAGGSFKGGVGGDDLGLLRAGGQGDQANRACGQQEPR